MNTPSQYQGEMGNYCFIAQHWWGEQSGDGSLVPFLTHCPSSVLVAAESWEAKQRHGCISRPFSLRGVHLTCLATSPRPVEALGLGACAWLWGTFTLNVFREVTGFMGAPPFG